MYYIQDHLKVLTPFQIQTCTCNLQFYNPNGDCVSQENSYEMS